MNNLSEHDRLLQSAALAINRNDFSEAELLYKTIIRNHSDCLLAYWQLGLVKLLQGQEDEANLIWLTLLADAEPQQEEEWFEQLYKCLQVEALQRERNSKIEMAWLIRQHMREFKPDDLDNLLHLIQDCLNLNHLQSEHLDAFAIIALLDNASPPLVPVDILRETLKDLLSLRIYDPKTLDFFLASVPHLYFSEVEAVEFLEFFIPKLHQLRQAKNLQTLAYGYAQATLKIDKDNAQLFNVLAAICLDNHLYAEAIEWSVKFHEFSKNLNQKILSKSFTIRGLMSLGDRWPEVQQELQQLMVLLSEYIIPLSQSPEGSYIDISSLSQALYVTLYFDLSHEQRLMKKQLMAIYQDQANHWLSTLEETYTPHFKKVNYNSSEPPSKLRIGYLSAFFIRHPVIWLSRWLFKYFDRSRFEFYNYVIPSNEPDDFSKQWIFDQSTCTRIFLQNTYELQMAKIIKSDNIDILVDLDSLTSAKSCNILAFKPAPIQISWLGLDGTGLPGVDYFIADPYVLPENAQDYYNEKIWRLPHTYLSIDGFEIGTPSLRREDLAIPPDAVVYFSSQMAYKRHPSTIRLQLQIIAKVPNSYFLIKGVGNKSGVEKTFGNIAQEIGVSNSQLRFLDEVPNEETHRANMTIADVILDTYPYNGATTTIEALWLGIPIVTKVGQQFSGRNSYTMMMNVGITEGIAWSDEDYIGWGIRFGNDSHLRHMVRNKLFESRKTSPLWNGKQFTRTMEAAYEQMWENHIREGVST